MWLAAQREQCLAIRHRDRFVEAGGPGHDLQVLRPIQLNEIDQHEILSRL